MGAAQRCVGAATGTGAFPGCVHVADKPDAPACDGADQFLFLAVVADRVTRGVDAAHQGRIRHDPAAPDRRKKIVLADDPVAILHQETSRSKTCGSTAMARSPTQLPPVRIKRMIVKQKLHSGIPAYDGRNQNQGAPQAKSMVRQCVTGGFRASQHRTEAGPRRHAVREGRCRTRKVAAEARYRLVRR